MKLMRLALLPLLTLAVCLPALPAQPPKKAPPKKAPTTANAMPHSKLPPAELIPNLCVVTYRISTGSPECQAFFDQGLGFYYSYTWAEAVRSFETATKYDPGCAMAWWGLSKACEKWGRAPMRRP